MLPPIDGLRDTEAGPALGPADGAHVLHTMGDMFAVLDSIESRLVETAMVVGARYIGLEIADALTVRGIRVNQVEALPQVLPTVDSKRRHDVPHAAARGHGLAGSLPNGAASVAALVAAGADVNASFVGEHADTPPHWAARTDDVEVLDALLDAGANIDAEGGAVGDGIGTPVLGQWQPRAAWSSVALRPDRGRKPVWAWSTPSLAGSGRVSRPTRRRSPPGGRDD